jgi:hypothetical protein
MKLYGIYQGCVYEGGGCENELYTTLEYARQKCLHMVASRQAELDKRRKNKEFADYISDHPDWTEKHENYWSDSYDCIAVKEFELIEELTIKDKE